MADIALSSGVRTNLQSLQNIAHLLTTSQERLSTGKKVNSVVAGDTPIGNLGAGATIKDKTRTALLSGNGVAAGETLTFTTVSGGVTKSFDFLVGAASTIGNLVDAVNASGVASARINDNGTLTFEAQATTSFTIASDDGLDDGDLGVAAAASFAPAAPTTVAGDDVDYSGQFVDLLTNITNAATDANFNGINLLAAGNQLDVTFDAKSGNNITVNSQDVSSTGLGLSFTALDSSNIDAVLTALDDAVDYY